MTYLNVDVANAVNPYLSDMGVGLVFGLGYYVIKYIYGDQKDDEKTKKVKVGSWDTATTIEEFNELIKANEYDPNFNPFEVIDKMSQKSLNPDITIFNNLLNTCYVSSNFEAADKLVEEMFDYASPVQTDLSSFNILLKGVSLKLDKDNSESEKKELLKTMEKIFDDVKKHSTLKPNDVTINTILDILIKGGEFQKAWDLFDEMRTTYDIEPDKYSYSTIIKALKYDLDSSKLERAFGILEYLKNKNTQLNDEIIFNCLIDVCIKLNCIDKAEKVFYQMKEVGVYPSKITYAIMIKGYGQFYDLDRAFKIFEEMKHNSIQPNEIIYGCLLHACVRCADIKKLTLVYNEIKANNIEMNIVIYTTLIRAYTKAHDFATALDVYETLLKDSKVRVNIIAHNAMLDCCVESGKVNKMNEIYTMIKEKFYADDNEPQPDLITYSTVIKGYAKDHDMNKVFDIYQFLKNGNDFKLDEVIYNSILDGCVKQNLYDRALEVYTDMKNLNILPSNVTYSILIKLFANAKKDDKALSLLDEMKSNGVKPGVIVYTCLIQMCFKTKRFNEGIKLFEEMKGSQIKPDHVIFNIVVNGCLYHHEWELACKYTLESFNFNVKIATEIYINVLKQIISNYCDMKKYLKCEYSSQIVKELKDRGVDIDYEIYSKVAKFIYKVKGVKLNVTSKTNMTENWNEDNNINMSSKNTNKDGLKSTRNKDRK